MRVVAAYTCSHSHNDLSGTPTNQPKRVCDLLFNVEADAHALIAVELNQQMRILGLARADGRIQANLQQH